MPGPTSTTPKLWLKADAGVYNDAGTTLCTDGQTVRQWNDQSGNGNHAFQTSGTKPTWTASARHSLPSVTFNGSQNLLHPYAAMPATIIVVGRNTGTGNKGWAGCASTNGAGSGGVYYFKCSDTSTDNSEFFWTTTAATFVGKTAGRARIGDWYVQMGRFNSSSLFTESAHGANILSTATGSGTLATATTPGVLGGTWVAPADTIVDQLVGDIQEFLIYDQILSDAEIAQIVQYLGRWWNAPQRTVRAGDYVWAGFQDPAVSLASSNPERLGIKYSSDGISWADSQNVSYTPSGGNGSVRDPDIIHRDGYWWVVHTNGGFVGSSFVSSRTFSLARSSDLINWTEVAVIDCSAQTPVGGFTWAPSWMVDETDTTKVRVLVACGGVICYVSAPASTSNWGTAGLWSAAAVVTGTGFPATAIDPAPIKVGSTWYLWFKDVSNSVVSYCTSSSPVSGYGSATTPDLGVSSLTPEGPTPISVGGTNYRVYVDVIPSGGAVQIYYADSTDTMVTFSAGVHTEWAGELRHGGIAVFPTASGGGTNLLGADTIAGGANLLGEGTLIA